MRPILTLALILFAGCSDSPDPKSGDPWPVNNGTSNNGTSNNGSSNNGTTANNGDECVGPSPDCVECEAPVCRDGVWSCEPTPCVGPQDCQQTGGSDLPGASIEFTGERCSWTLDEVAAGIVIPYTVTIQEPLEVSVEPGQSGCEPLGPGNLRPAFTISGGAQLYCLCDQGLCPGGAEMVTLEPGVYDAEIEWTGRNWTGPSDTGNPMGDPFPPGEYSVEVQTGGTYEQSIFQVYQTLFIELTE